MMHNKTVDFIMQLHHTTQCRTTQHSEVSKYQLISQPKLDKFQLQCYSRCSKWRPLVSMQQCRCLRRWSTDSLIIVAETKVYAKALATRHVR